MRDFRLIHIAVNLLLIAAVAIQPVAICLANVDGVAGCSKSSALSACPGCGCCETDHTDDRCCCALANAKPEEAPQPSCCDSEQDAPRQSTKPASEDQSIDEPRANAVVPFTFRPSTCLCEQSPQPLSDSSPRRPASEQRDIAAIAATVDDRSPWHAPHGTAKTRYGILPVLPPHFSQVVLCIWRL